jgi:hypothetical protein
MVRASIQGRRAFVRGQRGASASQRIVMQNDPHCSLFGLGLRVSPLEDAFERAHAHARAKAPHDTGSMLGACSVSHARESEDDSTQSAPDEELLHGTELLCALREPIEWLLTLAHRLAADESEEIAAVDQLRAAFHAALAGRAIGVRMQDALVAFALLLSALDPDIVHGDIARCAADGVVTLLRLEAVSPAAQRPRVANSTRASVPQTRAPRRRSSGTPL